MALISDDELKELIYKFSSKSKYLSLWLELKYKHLIIIKIEDRLNAHRNHCKALNELKAADSYYLQYCMLTYGHRLDFKSKSIDRHTLEIRLVPPTKDSKFI